MSQAWCGWITFGQSDEAFVRRHVTTFELTGDCVGNQLEAKVTLTDEQLRVLDRHWGRFIWHLEAT